MGEAFLNYHEGNEQLLVLDVLATGTEVLDVAFFNSLAWFMATL